MPSPPQAWLCLAACGRGRLLRAEAGSLLWVSVGGRARPLASHVFLIMVQPLVQQSWGVGDSSCVRSQDARQGRHVEGAAAWRAVSSAVTSASAWAEWAPAPLARSLCRGRRAALRVSPGFLLGKVSNNYAGGRGLERAGLQRVNGLRCSGRPKASGPAPSAAPAPGGFLRQLGVQCTGPLLSQPHLRMRRLEVAGWGVAQGWLLDKGARAH